MSGVFDGDEGSRTPAENIATQAALRGGVITVLMSPEHRSDLRFNRVSTYRGKSAISFL
jgi:hypothetical protein